MLYNIYLIEFSNTKPSILRFIQVYINKLYEHHKIPFDAYNINKKIIIKMFLDYLENISDSIIL